MIDRRGNVEARSALAMVSRTASLRDFVSKRDLPLHITSLAQPLPQG